MDWPPPAPPWPTNAEELVAAQNELARATAAPWPTPADMGRVAACFVCFERGRTGPGVAGERGWAAACLAGVEGEPPTSIVRGLAEARYEPGLLALREGPLLEAALRSLPAAPDLLVVNATGRDHPRRAGLALHLGARLGLPSIGVTNRPLLASGASPEDRPEVKSLARTSESQQLRLGLGQVLDYRQAITTPEIPIRAALVIEQEPSDLRWVEVCAAVGVVLAWPERFAAVLVGIGKNSGSDSAH